MRVAFDDQHPAALVDGDAGGRDDVGLGGELFDDDPRIERLRPPSSAAASAATETTAHRSNVASMGALVAVVR